MLTWKDAVTTLLAVATGFFYYAQVKGFPVAGTLGTRWTVAILAVVGIIMCSMSSYDPEAKKSAVIIIASVLGGLSLILILTGLITGLKFTIPALVSVTLLLWLIATVRHLGIKN